MATNSGWIWSAPHNDYYYVTYDMYSRPMYTWAKQAPATNATAPVTHETTAYHPGPRARVDSGHQEDPPEGPPDPVSQAIRAHLPGFISGTPDRGWTEQLDQSYKMRTGREAYTFFQPGKVFAMLHSEAAGAQSAFNGNDDAYSFVRYNEVVYSTIRRFIVADVRQGFVYACAISTYSNRGTLKQGCIPSEHAIVYSTDTDPASCYFPYETGMTKDPIEVIPATTDPSLVMKRESRVRFSKKFSIEMNVKVKDVGRVHPVHMSKFMAYYDEYS